MQLTQVRAAQLRSFILLCDSACQSNGSDGRVRAERDFLIRTLNTVAERRRVAGGKRLRQPPVPVRRRASCDSSTTSPGRASGRR